MSKIRKKTKDVKYFEQKILEAEEHIEEAILKLSRLESVLENVCSSIQKSLDFHFVSMSLVDPEQNTIEAIYGTGMAAQWTGRAKHHLDDDPVLRDIQADIVLTQKTEIISGWDNRFDRGVFEEYGHYELARIYTPILLFQDDRGEVIENWFERCEWEVIKDIKKEDGQQTICQISLPEELNSKQGNVLKNVIGTVEAGYKPKRSIGIEQARKLAKLVAEHALYIWESQLPCALKTIPESAVKIVQADSATLHFPYDRDRNQYAYEVFAGQIGQHFLQNYRPRKSNKGLGQQAMREGKCKFIPDPSQNHEPLELKKTNPKVFSVGVRAMAAFPLKIDQKDGVIYVEFNKEHQFTADELSWGEFFANRAVDAIRRAITYQYVRYEARRLNILHSVAQSLSQAPGKSDLLRIIAWNTLNLLAADVITIYEYIETDKKFCFYPDTLGFSPNIAGRLKFQELLDNKFSEDGVPFSLIRNGKNIYASRVKKYKIFRDSSFVKRENIRSVAGILLKVGEEIVGIIFINFRRIHNFSKDEKKLIETLASSAAIAIKNQRWLETLCDIDREIVTLDQEKLLKLIVEKAVQITGAKLGEIRLLDPINQYLYIKAIHPENIPLNPKWNRLKVGKGIVGLVAEKQSSILVPNVQENSSYKSCWKRTKSELCVPLLDKDKLLGVLNVESNKFEAFDWKHQSMLETLANQAVIAIQNARNKEQLVATEKIVALGDLASALVHQMNGQLGAIQAWSQKIITKGDKFSQDAAHEIYAKADQGLESAKSLNNWHNDKPEPIDLRQLFHNLLEQIELPLNITFNDDFFKKDLPQVWAGKQQLMLVFRNLIENAKEAMTGGGELSIVGEKVDNLQGCWAVIKVSDTGEGISPENQPKIFQANYTTKDGYHGGFGLWWSDTYVRRLNGQIKVKSFINEGTIITVILPSYQSEAGEQN